MKSRDVINRDHKPIINPILSATHPMRETHQKIQFWRYEDYNDWLLQPEAQHARRGKEPYLEEENGEPVSNSRVTSICECIWSAWCKLVNMKCTPQVLGELDTTGREFFHTYVEKSWSLFKCAEGGWKLDRMA